MKRENFFAFRNILAIDPAYSHENATGYAIFETYNYHLQACGLIKPIIPNVDTHQTTIEIADNLRKVWEYEVGFSYDPKVLCIEHPPTCFMKNGVRVKASSIINLAILCTRIEERFSAKTVLRPYPQTWKQKDQKADTQALVLAKLDKTSLKRLAQNLSSVTKRLQHNVFDAIALALWAIEKQTNDKS